MEALVATGIFTIVVVAATNAFVHGSKLYDLGTKKNQAQNIAREASRRISDSLRETSDSEEGSYAMELAEGMSISFYSDYNQEDGTEKISYYLSGTDLMKDEIDPSGNPLSYPEGNTETTTIGQYIRNTEENPIFSYYDADGNELTSPANPNQVRIVGIKLVVNLNPAKYGDFTLDTKVNLRNLNQ